MSHSHPPTLAMPGGHKLETLLVCPDGTCGRCVRCDYLAKSRGLVEQNVRLIAATDKALKEWQALAALRGECLSTIAHSIDDIKAKTALLELVEMTPEKALAAITERDPHEEATK